MSGSRDPLGSRLLESGRYEADSVESFIGVRALNPLLLLPCRDQKRAGTASGQRAEIKLGRG
jgi:hypothetical protein